MRDTNNRLSFFSWVAFWRTNLQMVNGFQIESILSIFSKDINSTLLCQECCWKCQWPILSIVNCYYIKGGKWWGIHLLYIFFTFQMTFLKRYLSITFWTPSTSEQVKLETWPQITWIIRMDSTWHYLTLLCNFVYSWIHVVGICCWTDLIIYHSSSWFTIIRPTYVSFYSIFVDYVCFEVNNDVLGVWCFGR